MSTVTRLHRAAGSMALAEASRRFLRRDAFEPTTCDTYGRTLAALVEVVGANADVAAVTTEQLEDDLFDVRWADLQATTYNRHRAALLSFFGWCIEPGWTAANPVTLVGPRKVRRRSEDERRERPIERDLLAELWTLDGVAGRDRLFWRMAYETWARAEELLGLNITDLDPGRREGHVPGKGGNRETVWWATGTARLLPRVSDGRTTGPLFLAARRPTKPMPAADVDPRTGRARLSYRQAERLFGEAGRRLDPGGAPWTLHRLRHAGIAHAVCDGWNLAQVRAKSRHSSLRSLEVYANPSADSIRAMTDALDSDLARFTTAGLGTVHGAAAEGLLPGGAVLVADEDSDALRAEVVAVRSGAANLRVFWDRPLGQDAATPVVRLELSPVARDLGVTEVTDADLDAGRHLRVGDRVELVDESGHHIAAVVTATEPARYGGLRYRVRFPV